MENKNEENGKNTGNWAPFLKTFLQAALLLGVIAVVVVLISNHAGSGQPKEGSDQGEGGVSLMVSLIAISTGIMVGFQIFNTLEYRHVLKEFDDKAKKLEDKARELEKKYENINELEGKLNKEMTDIDRLDGDHARMTALLLGEAGKPTWAMGWVLRALNSYFKAYEREPDHLASFYPQLVKQCLSIETSNIGRFVKKAEPELKDSMSDSDYKRKLLELFSGDNDEDRGNNGLVIKRAYRDMIDSRIGTMDNIKELQHRVRETSQQTTVIEHYIMLVTANMSEDEIVNAGKSSRFQSQFYAKVHEFQKSVEGKSIRGIFNELTGAVNAL